MREQSTKKREHRMKEPTKIIVAGVSTAALAAGGIGAGLAYADTPTGGEPTTRPTVTATSNPADTTPTTEPSDKRDQNRDRRGPVRRHLRFMARALHGEVTLAGEKHQVIAFQRGTVEEASSTSVTVKSKDGFVETYLLSDDTKVREDRHDATVSDIDAADRVLVVATKEDSSLNARRVVVRDD
jgi:hypothetical protein